MAGIELHFFDGQAVLVIHCKYLLLLIDWRSALYVIGMKWDKGHGMAALHPADGLNVMNLVTRNPDIVMPVMDPGAGVAHSPTIRVRVHVRIKQGRYYLLLACYRIPDHSIAKSQRHAGKVRLLIQWAIE
jgi:hypothetical protein